MQTIPVFYAKEMVAESNGYSPSAAKPAQVVADWQKHNLPIEFKAFLPTRPSELGMVHHPDYVDAILSGRVRNGHHNRDKAIAESCLWTCGSMMAAAQHAMGHGIACSPSSGFHHANYDYASGFCTFNALAMVAKAMIDAEVVDSVLLIDGDAHEPDGVIDIKRRRRIDELKILAFSDYSGKQNAGDFVQDAVASIVEISKTADPGRHLILYQAGADAHMDDPLNAGWMTTREMRNRDRAIFTFARAKGIPLVWNLAGGYQRNRAGEIPVVLELHRNTMQECAAVYCDRSKA